MNGMCTEGNLDGSVNDLVVINAKRILLICSSYRYNNVMLKINNNFDGFNHIRQVLPNDTYNIAGKFDTCIIDDNDGFIDGKQFFEDVYPYLKDNVGNFYIYTNGQSN